MFIDFASPIPLYAISWSTEDLPIESKLFLKSESILLESSTADSEVFPEPIRIAINSALLKAASPCLSIFSRGRSSSAHCLMDSFSYSDIISDCGTTQKNAINRIYQYITAKKASTLKRRGLYYRKFYITVY